MFFSLRLSERTKILSSYVKLLEEVAIKLPYTSSNLAELFSDNFADFRFLPTNPFAPQFRSMTARYSDILTKDDIRLLDDFTRELGSSDTVSQLNHIRLYIDLLKERLQTAREEVEQKSKIYRVLPLSVGIITAILLF